MTHAKTLVAICAITLASLSPALAQVTSIPPQPQTNSNSNSQVRESVDLRPSFERWNLPVRSQGRRNTCSVFVAVGAFEYALAKHNDEGLPLSVEFANWACNQVIHNSTADRGQFFHHLLEGFEEHGLCQDNLMTYEQRFDNTQPSDQAKANAIELKKLGFKIHWIRNWSKDKGLANAQFDEVLQTLNAGWPVCAGSNHSRLLVGYEVDQALPGGGQFLTRDSGLGQYDAVSFEWAKQNVYDLFWVELPIAEKTDDRANVYTLANNQPAQAPPSPSPAK